MKIGLEKISFKKNPRDAGWRHEEIHGDITGQFCCSSVEGEGGGMNISHQRSQKVTVRPRRYSGPYNGDSGFMALSRNADLSAPSVYSFF